jgi:hypothetical protein
MTAGSAHVRVAEALEPGVQRRPRVLDGVWQVNLNVAPMQRQIGQLKECAGAFVNRLIPPPKLVE